jgi:hypothetical protein
MDWRAGLMRRCSYDRIPIEEILFIYWIIIIIIGEEFSRLFKYWFCRTQPQVFRTVTMVLIVDSYRISFMICFHADFKCLS